MLYFCCEIYLCVSIMDNSLGFEGRMAQIMREKISLALVVKGREDYCEFGNNFRIS